ncbi:putative disease resistance protein RGA3 [Telopea speciosissima]|uniref:putative disease resistance protein RGA3 n=1 Tax=Telopea speciosissima TaxID=54955 RepID=UPI001CC75C8D|nr:putative disease resistance protein RGA3 [Telopea speciosissima]
MGNYLDCGSNQGCSAIFFDKDNQPKWKLSKLELITNEMVDQYFTKEDDDDWEDLRLDTRSDEANLARGEGMEGSELCALSDVHGKIKKLLNLHCYEKDERYGGGKVRLHFPSNLKSDGLLRKQEIVPLINDELIKKLGEIEKELKHYYLSESSGNQKLHGGSVIDEIDTRPKSGSLLDESLTLGRKEDVEAIKNKLLSSNPNENQKQVSVIAIVGLGGLGKTTLAQLVYNDPDVKKHFESRAWVCVSTDFNAVRLTSAILESLSKKNNNLSDLEPLQHKLRDELRGKRFLIILDDVWTEKNKDWEPLRVAFMEAGEEGSRMIVTTRSRRVSSIMHPMYTHDLQILSDEECWSIMERHISLNYCSIAPSLEEVGRKIARKCKGLPLAASTVAGLLSSSSSSDLNHWEEVLNSSMWDLEESKDLPAALSLSYYFLPTHLKQCFAYCSVFPKDYEFRKHRLIQLWSAEGFIRTDTRMKDKAGGQYFDELLQRSFFQNYNKGGSMYKFVMHDLVHDLAEAVSGDVYGRFDGRKSSHSSKETRYSSIYLYASEIKMLSDDIGDLKYLHYINLSFAHDIERLPESLCDLFNLQSLILRCCPTICELPRGMKYVHNLQHLDLRDCISLRSMPKGIGRLSSLKTLSKFPVLKDDDDGCGIRELKELRQLEGALSIRSLQNVIDPLDAREADLMTEAFRYLQIQWVNISTMVDDRFAKLQQASLSGTQQLL